MRAVALLLLFAAACSDLESIEAGACGNGAIDETEDCDSTDASQCVACQLVCQGEDRVCPTGYACGADRICRAPSGVFYATAATTFTTTDYAASDVNKDGADDVIGLTPTSINVVQGAATPAVAGDAIGLFSTRFSMLTPFGRGQPVFADFTDDGHTDVLLPSADGLAGFSTRYETLGAHAFAFNPGGGGDNDMEGYQPAVVFSFHPGYVAFLFPATVFGQPGLRLGMLDVNSGDTGPNTTFMPAICNDVMPSPDITYDAYIINGSPLEALVAVRDPMHHVCVFRVTIPGAGTDPFAVAPLASRTIAESVRPVFADFDGNGCPSVIVGLGKEVRASGTAPACSLATLATPFPLSSAPVGRVQVQTPQPGMGPDALITSAGVFAIPTLRNQPLALYASDRQIDVSASSDINADGKLDAVLASKTSNGVDVLFRTDMGFLLYRIGTTGFVTNLATGDYDGNGVGDIVFTERLDRERLMVAYGTSDLPLAPVENGRFTNVISFLPVQIRDSIDRDGIVRDLAVVDMPMPGELLLTVLHGSPQRTLVSYFDPRNGGGGNFESGTGFFAAVSGQFAPHTTASDVVAIEWERSLMNPRARLYLNVGVGNGALNQSVEPSAAQPTPIWFNLTGVAEGEKCSAASFCLDRARYLALRRAPVDRLIGIDRSASPHAIAIDVATLTPTTDRTTSTPNNTPTSIAGLEPGAGFELVSLRGADIDGDGLDDAIGTFVSSTNTAETRLCTKDNFTACSSLTELASESTLVCGDVAPARAQARGQFDDPVVGAPMEAMPLVALCEDTSVGGRYVYRFVHAAGAFTATRLFAVSRTAVKLEIGDVNGDGLDDILVLDTRGGSMIPELQAFLQCRSTDLDCRERGTK